MQKVSEKEGRWEVRECKPRVFYDEKRERIILVEQNPCGCHHLDVLVQWGNKYGESCTYSFDDDLCIESYLENRFIELGDL